MRPFGSGCVPGVLVMLTPLLCLTQRIAHHATGFRFIPRRLRLRECARRSWSVAVVSGRARCGRAGAGRLASPPQGPGRAERARPGLFIDDGQLTGPKSSDVVSVSRPPAQPSSAGRLRVVPAVALSGDMYDGPVLITRRYRGSPPWLRVSAASRRRAKRTRPPRSLRGRQSRRAGRLATATTRAPGGPLLVAR